jgi:hypothetical protein
MNTKIASLVVSKPKETVFSYLSDISNLPAWATEFCHGLKVVQGTYKVFTPVGELIAKVKSDEVTGVIDFFAGPSEAQLSIFPLRVLELPDKSSLITFTLIQTPGTTDEHFEKDYASVNRELENVKRIFSDN